MTSQIWALIGLTILLMIIGYLVGYRIGYLQGKYNARGGRK
jgi:hypothetical protein